MINYSLIHNTYYCVIKTQSQEHMKYILKLEIKERKHLNNKEVNSLNLYIGFVQFLLKFQKYFFIETNKQILKILEEINSMYSYFWFLGLNL